MKRLLFLSACFVIFMASCQVHNDALVAPTSTITATVDGVNESFNSNDTVRSIGSTGMYVSGTNAANSDKIIFILGSSNGLDTGKYSSTAATNNGIQVLYGVGPGYTADNYYYNYNISGGPSYDGTLTITSISSTRVQGTFSGTLVQESSVFSTGIRLTKTIANGKFDLIKQ